MGKSPDLEILFYVADSGIHGKGLFARCAIAAGTYLGEYDGPETDENGMHVLWAETEEGDWIGRDGQNLLRYINHSEAPCAEFEGFELYAVAAIEPDQEITIHYGDEFEPD
ncbi:MAG TPA: SET domain-containing protein [Thioalkalivibrio sp.]|nr:SET domain-containing protein [Thioalkalivibrio sp.]